MNNYIFDTDILINHLRQYENIEIIIEELNLPNDSQFYYISAITKLEVLSGKSINKSKFRAEADLLLDQFKQIEIDDSIIELASKLRREGEIKLADAIIAATAINREFTLITRNIKHFRNISKLDLLKL